MVKKAAITTPEQMLDALLRDCTEHDNGYIRCRHCRASSYPKEPLLHDGECVAGQILVARATPERGDLPPAAAPDAGAPQENAGTNDDMPKCRHCGAGLYFEHYVGCPTLANELERELAIVKLAIPLEDELYDRIDETCKHLATEQGFTLNGIARLLIDCQRRMASDWTEIGSLRRRVKTAEGRALALPAHQERTEPLKRVRDVLDRMKAFATTKPSPQQTRQKSAREMVEYFTYELHEALKGAPARAAEQENDHDPETCGCGSDAEWCPYNPDANEATRPPTFPCRGCAQGLPVLMLDRDGVRTDISKLPGIPSHAVDEYWWPCPHWQHVEGAPARAAEWRTLLKRMRSDASRCRVVPGGEEVVSARTVDDWADDIEELLPPGALAGDSNRKK